MSLPACAKGHFPFVFHFPSVFQFPLFSNSSLNTQRAPGCPWGSPFSMLSISVLSSGSPCPSHAQDPRPGLRIRFFELIFPARQRFHGTDPMGKKNPVEKGRHLLLELSLSLCHQSVTVGTALPQGFSAAKIPHSRASLEQEDELDPPSSSFHSWRKSQEMETSSSHPALPNSLLVPFGVFFSITQELFCTPAISESWWSP